MLLPVEKLLILESRPLRQALQLMDATAQGFCFIVDETGRMTGMLTDGDIRRVIISGVDVRVPVSQVMRREFKSLPAASTTDAIQNALTSTIRFIPLLAEDGRPIEYASSHRLKSIDMTRASFTGNELAYATGCIRGGQISTNGEYVARFEQAVAEFVHAPFTLAVSNGSAALRIALLSLRVGPGDEVIVPALAMPSVAEQVLQIGAVPVFVDVGPRSWTIDVPDVERAISSRCKAIIAVHAYGNVCDMGGLGSLAATHDLAIIEDASDAFGCSYNGQPIGSLGNAAVFDFDGTRAPTTGAGGMIVLRDRSRYDWARDVRDGRSVPDHAGVRLLCGVDCRLTNIQGAIGLAQVERADEIVEGKRRVADAYTSRLGQLDGIEVRERSPGAIDTSAPFTIVVNERSRVSRDELIDRLRFNGIASHAVVQALPLMPGYDEYGANRTFDVSVRLSDTAMCLPSDPTISSEEIEAVCRTFESILFVRGLL